MIVIRPLLIICFMIAGALNIDVAAPITAITDLPAPEPTPDVPADDSLTPDSRLGVDGHAHSRLDLIGRNMTLNPSEEPVVIPQSQSGGWQNLGTGLPGLNGPIYAIAISGTNVYVGGRFTDAGGISGANNLARWDGSQWHAVGGTNAITGTINAIVVSGNDVYVGGIFTNAGGVSGANNLARWDGSRWHAVGGTNAITGTVNTIAVSSSDVYIGGFFTKAGGVSGANNLARWDGSQWHAVGGGTNGIVASIAISGTNVYIGGAFFNVGGVSGTDSLARWDGSRWHPVGGATSSGINNGFVASIAISGPNVYVGGQFTNAGGVTGANNLARWDGSRWLTVGSPGAINGPVYAIAVSGSNVYAGGGFTNAGGSGASYLARWDGNQWRAVGSVQAMNNWVLAISIDVIDGADHVYVGGEFTNANGVDHADYVARWDGEQWLSLRAPSVSAINGPVSAIAVSGSDVYIGGNFTNVGGVDGADYLARWDGRRWHAVGTPGAINGPVNAIAVSGTDVYVGGQFTNAGGVSGANYVARWNGTQWSGLLSGTFGISGTVNTIAISGTHVYVGGDFTDAGGVPGADYVARWNGTQWSGLLSGTFGISSTVNTTVNTIAISGTHIYVGGDFTDAGGVSGADYVACAILSGTTSVTWTDLLDSTFGISGTVNAIAISGGNLYVGGAFTDAGGASSADRIARWDGSRWHAIGTGVDGNVRALVVRGTGVYVGGDFPGAGGMPGTNHLARWDGARWRPVGDEIVISSIAVSGTDVYVGGAFTRIGGVSGANSLARWDGSQWHAVGPPGAITGTVYAIAVSGGNV
ncbi:MAG: hypothetical protein J7463_17125, partial [Roseiflexus sp.]|nr:hypothetical protein [Roseiflexus sp.]